MPFNLFKEFLLKNRVSTEELLKVVDYRFLIKPYYRISNNISILNILELTRYGLNYKGFNKNGKSLIKYEKFIPIRNADLTLILAIKIRDLFFLKTNFTRFSVKKHKVVRLYWLELIGTYRGWRHMNGLPVRGQRTWTNAWSVYKSNVDLREFIVLLAKNIYSRSNLNFKIKSLIYMAEHVNKVWALQWEKEWKLARKKRKEALKRDYKSYTINLARLAAGDVNTKKVRKHRKKQAKEKKNLFYLGFDKGFSKFLLERNKIDEELKNVANKRVTTAKRNEKKNLKVIFTDASKNIIKKKVLTKAQKAEQAAKRRKNILLKKKKKSIWD